MSLANLAQTLDLVLSLPKGQTIPGRSPLARRTETKAAVAAQVLSRTSQRVYCAEHETDCEVERRGGALVAYHAEGGVHQFEVTEEDTFHYVVSFPETVRFTSKRLFGDSATVSEVSENHDMASALVEVGRERIRLILVPKASRGTEGAIYSRLAEMTGTRAAGIIAFDLDIDKCSGPVHLLSKGYAGICLTSFFEEAGYASSFSRECLQRAGIERVSLDLFGSAHASIGYDIEPAVCSDTSRFVGSLLESCRAHEWKAYERLCRFALSRLYASPLEGFGAEDSGRLPDSVAILPDNNGRPDRFVIIDSKSLLSARRERFRFERTDPAKYLSYVQNADALSNRIDLHRVTLLFVAPEYSPENCEAFVSDFRTEREKARLQLPTDVVFLTHTALAVLYLTFASPTHSVVLKSKDPHGEFERLMISPRELQIKHLVDGGAPCPRFQGEGYVILHPDDIGPIFNHILQNPDYFAAHYETYRRLSKQL
ncbi:MAG TPA: hypothetical protein VFG07_07360 [Thermoplasmata archaeon]|nr:hypothetical protein [Thermoplasmata archaeon]